MPDPKGMWNGRYGEEGFAYGTEPNTFVAETADAITGKDVLCIACGEGRNVVFLAQRGLSVTGVDLSEVGIEKTKALAAERGVQVRAEVASLDDYDLGQSKWDAIVAIFAHVPPPLRRKVHQAIPAALRPGGVVLLEAYTPKQLEHGTGGPPALPMLMTLDELEEDFAGLEFELGHEIEREVVEGRYHTGQAAVVQVVARRR